MSKAIPFFLMPYLTRKLGADGFGELSFFQAISVLLLIIIGLNQDGAIARYFYTYGNRAVGLINFVAVSYSSFIFILAIIVSFFFKSEILFLCSFVAYSQSVLSNLLILRQMQKKVRGYLLIQLVNSISTILITFILFELLKASSENRMYAAGLSCILTIIFAFFFVPGGAYTSYKKIRLTKSNILAASIFLLSFGLPLILHNLSLFARGQFDRILVFNVYSDEELGIYSASFQIASILLIFLLALNKATIPYYYECLKNSILNRAKLNKIILFSCFFIPVPSLIAFIIPNDFYIFILGDGFDRAKLYIMIFLLGISVNLPYFIAVNYLFYYGRTMLISIGSFFSAVIHVFLIFTIGTYDMIFMAFSLFISNFILMIIVLFFLNSFNQGD